MSERRVYVEVGIATLGAASLPAVLLWIGLPVLGVVMGAAGFMILLGALAIWRWDLPIPFRAPWARLVLPAAAVMAINLVGPIIAWKAGVRLPVPRGVCSRR